MVKSKVTDADRARILLEDGKIIGTSITSLERRFIVDYLGKRYTIQMKPKKTIITMVGKADGQKT